MISVRVTKNVQATKRFGEALARKILKTKKQRNRAAILGLIGDLGGGKTTFLQGFARGLGIKEKILSPTFVIVKRFKIKYPKSKFQNFYHIDCYRIKKPKEILELEFKEIISDPKNIVAVEWADKIKSILPGDAIVIRFDFLDKNIRRLKIRT